MRIIARAYDERLHTWQQTSLLLCLNSNMYCCDVELATCLISTVHNHTLPQCSCNICLNLLLQLVWSHSKNPHKPLTLLGSS